MKNSICFKDKDNCYRAAFLLDENPISPRKFDYPLGTMVFKDTNRYLLGDEQVKDWEEFFRSQLEPEKEFYKGKVSVKIPSVERATGDPLLEKFISGNAVTGRHIDHDYFNQAMDSLLNDLHGALGPEFCDEIKGGIPVDPKTGKYSDYYEIEFTTPDSKHCEDIAVASETIERELGYWLGDFGLKKSTDYNIETNPENDLDGLTESQLYDRWAATKAAVLPIGLVDHSGLSCYEADVWKTLHATRDRDDGFIYNNGFIYIDKDDEEFLSCLDKEKAGDGDYVREQAEREMRGEIEEYASYLEGDVHYLRVEEFNKKTLEWEVDDDCSFGSIYGSSLEETLKNQGFNIDHTISEKEVEELPQTVTNEFRKATWDKYIEDVRAALPDFDNKVEYASGAVLYAMKKNGGAGLKVKALGEYMTVKGCTSKERTIAFLNEALGLGKKQERLAEKIPVNDEHIECLWSKVKNPQRSDNGGCDQMLLVDYDNKTFAYLRGVSQIVSHPSDTYYKKTELLKSGKAVEKEVGKLVKSGFKNTVVSSDLLEEYRKKDTWIKKYILKEQNRER